ncbi:MAG TPA: hypothetical protein VEO54_15215 [Thermoanaerobaculia bacterium]|nr:hypothetical protein [Thermoanaerobaculia bacterium]
MTHTIRRVIPVITDDGDRVEIPYFAWADVAHVAEEEFDAEISFHLHPEPGAYHGFPYVPFAHYSIEVTLDEERVEAFKERINPLVNEIIESHTKQLGVPVGR